MILYGLKNCDSCKKALKALENAGKTVTFKDVRLDGVSEEQLDEWLVAIGRDKLVNTRSTTWRGLTEDERKIENNIDAKRLLINNPTLIKRPVIESDGQITVGWSKQEQARYL